ncbi:oligosaccharide flippase family protein [Priestia sp. FSL W8-0001]|uniref:oligosaccharide flippase family protein n=1 Tax=unclassified Priestia TaxID=2800374 RepID=UPI0030F66986
MINKLKGNLLVQNTMWMLLGLGGKTVLQLGYFVIIARSLGVDDYGVFTGVVALALILSPFSNLGLGHTLVKKVSRDKQQFNKQWGKTLFVTVFLGFVLSILFVGISQLLWTSKVSLTVILLIALAELIFAKVVEVSGQAFQAINKMKLTAQFQLIISLNRFISAIILYLLVSNNELTYWAILYCLSTCITAIYSFVMVTKKIGTPVCDLQGLIDDIKEGFFFSLNISFITIQNDIDKTMLSKFSTFQATGIYAAAYRLIEAAFMPMRSLINASYTSFFAFGKDGIKKLFKYSLKFYLISLCYGVAIGTFLYLFAPFVPIVLGDAYESTIVAIQYLAIIPLIKGVQYFLSNTLTCSGNHLFRTCCQISSAILNVCLCFYLIPEYSWLGAVIATVVCEVLLIILLGSNIIYLIVKESKGTKKQKFYNIS